MKAEGGELEFIRTPTKAEAKNPGSTNNLAKLPEREGYETVYKPYGPDGGKEGRGYYYRKSVEPAPSETKPGGVKMYGGGPSTEDLIKLATPGIEAGRDIKRGIQSLILPTANSPEHLAAADILGSKFGGMNRRGESAAHELQNDKRMFDKAGVHNPDLPFDQNIGFKFASDMSQGRPMTPKMQAIADKVEKGFQVRLKALEDAGAPLETIRANYFPGMWKPDSIRAFNMALDEYVQKGNVIPNNDFMLLGARERTAIRERVNELIDQGKGSDKDYLQYLARRPLKGKESFRKAKVFDDFMEPIEFGLRPVSNNPLDIVQLKYAEMDRSIMANQAFREFEAKGDLVSTDNSGRPLKGRTKDGTKPEPLDRSQWRKIKDRHGEIWRRDPDTHQLIKQGERWAKIPVADILDNYLSTSLYNSPYFGKAYKGLMFVGNSLNQSQLGWGSAFHAGFTALETQISAGAEVLKDIYGVARGNRTIGDLGKTVAKYPVAMVRTAVKGHQALKEWRNPIMNMPENVPVGQLLVTAPNQGGTAKVSNQRTRSALIAKAYELGGGHTTMDKGLRTHQTDKMFRDWYGGSKGKAILRSPIALSEAMMKPIMLMLVPRQKLGVFGEMAGRIIERNPGKTLNELRPEFRQAVNRVDARLGQVNYDRLFINNVAKNVIQAAIRSPGWSGGTLAEVGGSGKDAAKFLLDWQKTGKAPSELPDRIAYTLALLGTSMAANGILTYAFTGEKPKGMDWWAFRDGGKDKNGNPTRWLLPTYAKDIYAYWENWEETILNKTHPAISALRELYKGTTYYNEQFVNPKDSIFKRQWDRIQHIPQLYEPFWTRGMRQAGQQEGGVLETLKKSPGKIIAPEVGVMPATRKYTRTESDKIMDQYRESQGQKTKSPEEAAAMHERMDLETLGRAGKDSEYESKMAGMMETGKLTKQQKKNMAKKIENSKAYRFNGIPLDVAIEAYKVGIPEEKSLYAPILRKKIKNLKKSNKAKYNQMEDQIEAIQDDMENHLD